MEKNNKSNLRSQMYSENWFGLKGFLRITYHNAIEYLLHAWCMKYLISFNSSQPPNEISIFSISKLRIQDLEWLLCLLESHTANRS